MQPSLATTTRASALWLISASTFALTGCEAVKGIFKAGFWVGAIVVAIGLAVAFGLVRAFRG